MRTVLLVDDSPVVRRVLGRRLVAEGVVVLAESTAAAARSTELGALSCVIIDLELTDGDGAELAAALLGKRPSLPVAFFSAGAPPDLVERASAQGPVFAKPDVDAVVAWAMRAGQPPPTK